MRNNTRFYKAFRFEKGVCSTDNFELIGEEPLLIRVNDKPYTVVMRTPGEEVFHAAGLCLGEGIVDTADDFKTVGHDVNLAPNEVDIWLTPERTRKTADLLRRRTYISQTSCGICGKQLIQDLNQVLRPMTDQFKVGIHQVFECVEQLSENQAYYPRTRGSHAALLFDETFEILAFAEDVGRHNALDKAVGKLLMNGTLNRAELVVLSSRISYELVQKAARARLPMMISKSRPTALAVDMATSLNMTLACAFEPSSLILFCGEDRIKRN